jgi:hypothetical protein
MTERVEVALRMSERTERSNALAGLGSEMPVTKEF